MRCRYQQRRGRCLRVGVWRALIEARTFTDVARTLVEVTVDVRRSVPVEVDGVSLAVEVLGSTADGAEDISDRRWDLAHVEESITKLADLARRAVDRVSPDEATVEFGVAVKTEAGRLTGLLVSGGGEANFKITLTWSGADRASG